MPLVTVDGSSLPVDKKRTLVKELTDALEKAYGFPRPVYGVIIRENSPENVGNGGTLVIDRINQKNK